MAIVLNGTSGINTPDLESSGPVSGTTANFSGNVTLGSSVLATPSGSAPSYTCRAWVNFNGTGTVALQASGNVSSITDNGTGDYTVNFTTALPDADYAITGIAGNWASLYGTVQPYNPAGTLPSTTSFRFQTAGSGWAATDLANTFLAIFR